MNVPDELRDSALRIRAVMVSFGFTGTASVSLSVTMTHDTEGLSHTSFYTAVVRPDQVADKFLDSNDCLSLLEHGATTWLERLSERTHRATSLQPRTQTKRSNVRK